MNRDKIRFYGIALIVSRCGFHFLFTRKKAVDVLKTIGRDITFLILLAGVHDLRRNKLGNHFPARF